MLKVWQVAVLALLGAALWGLVTYGIHARTGAPVDKDLLRTLLVAPIVGWISVGLCKLVGRLSAEQILPGVTVVGAVAMLMDGVALRWFSGLYGFDEKLLRLSAADLLWGYGVGFAAALVWVWVGLARRKVQPSG